MKTWNNPEFVELNLNETAHEIDGYNPDGGYIGDGELSGHLWTGSPVPICSNGPCCVIS